MGCSSCGSKVLNKAKQMGSVVSTLTKAVLSQPDKIKWFKDGASGLLKCIEGKTLYSDKEIVKNRDICRQCEFSTKVDNKLVATSQCQVKDPDTGEICGCFILCKTQTDKCPINKFVPLTISQ